MTYRTYLRHPKQQVSDKTTTSDPVVAMVALARLAVENAGQRIAAVMSRDGRQQHYVSLDKSAVCDECSYTGPHIDRECPACYLAHPVTVICPACAGSGKHASGNPCGYCCGGGYVEADHDIPIVDSEK